MRLREALNFIFFVLFGALFAAGQAAAREAARPDPAKLPELNEVVDVQVIPPEMILSDPRYPRRILVSGRLKDGYRIDLTSLAQITPVNGNVKMDENGFLHPLEDGQTRVEIRVAGRQVELPVTVQGLQEPRRVSFVRDVMPVLNKAGCTAGACHGAAKGKNGFKLSLRGYDPEFDYHALIHDLSGRRFNRSAPSQSLMLAKPTQEIPHGGGQRFEVGSRYYGILLDWISGGVKFGDAESAKVQQLEVFPDDILMKRPELTQQVLVLARYSDGTLRDVTHEAVFRTTDGTVADVSAEGVITSSRKGEVALLVRYEGRFSDVTVTVLEEGPGYAWKAPPQYNYIDRYVDEKLKRLRILPSALASDAEFMRRVSLDLTGIPPTPARVRAFLQDKTPSRAKRSRLIDELMASPEFIDHWTLKWADLLQNNRKYLGVKGVWSFRHWIRQSIARNKPYDQFVRELITARGSSFRNPPASYYRVTREPKKAMETTTQLFLGVRMVCAQCHDHPFEKWTQNQYYQLSAFFGGIAVKEGMDSEEEVVYLKREDNQVKHPKTDQVMAPRFPFRHSDQEGAREDRLEAVADWLTAKENPFFAMAISNRLWSYFFGRGIIDPVDDIRSSNPATNAPLLQALTEDLKEHHFDLQYLIRTIVNSRTYQLSFRANNWNVDDDTFFSHATPRRLTAEQLMDAISVATGSAMKFDGVPKEARAVALPGPHVGKDGFLDVFGRPARESPTEGDRRSDISMTQTLNLINGPTVADAVADANGRVARLLVSGASEEELIEDLYLATLSRPPAASELQGGVQYLRKGGNRAERAQDMLWALLNSSAFLFNH